MGLKRLSIKTCLVVALCATAGILAVKWSGRSEVAAKVPRSAEPRETVSNEIRNEGRSVLGEMGRTEGSDTRAWLEESLPRPTAVQIAASTQRAAEGLPIETNLHRAVADRVDTESLEKMIANLGDTWGAVEGSGISDIPMSPASHQFMMQNLRGNIRVKRIIELGRAHPDDVANMVMKELTNRISGWRAMLKQHDEAEQKSKVPLGYGTSTTGEAFGNMASKEFTEYRYVIPSLVFIAANLDRKEGLQAISAFVRQVDIVHFSSEGPARYRPAYSELDMETVFWGAATLLLKHPEEDRYAPALKALKGAIGEAPVAVDISVTGSGAYWNGQEVAAEAGIVDVSMEPKMTLLIPNEKALSKISADLKRQIFVSMAVADDQLKGVKDHLKDQ
jgi:hypothetical protein